MRIENDTNIFQFKEANHDKLEKTGITDSKWYVEQVFGCK